MALQVINQIKFDASKILRTKLNKEDPLFFSYLQKTHYSEDVLFFTFFKLNGFIKDMVVPTLGWAKWNLSRFEFKFNQAQESRREGWTDAAIMLCKLNKSL